MTREELEMRTLVRESDVIDRTDGSELAKAFNYLWEKYVEHEPKTGHWIDSPNGYFTHCSECGLYGDKGIYKHYGWCPKCGAKMVEPQERSEE